MSFDKLLQLAILILSDLSTKCSLCPEIKIPGDFSNLKQLINFDALLMNTGKNIFFKLTVQNYRK